MIRHVLLEDAAQLAAIYNHYIANTVITFEEIAITAADMQNRINSHINAPNALPWLVWEQNQQILGYAYACQWKVRSAYRFSAEVTVYLHPEHFGKGLGSALYQQLFNELPACNIHALLAVITLPNEPSVALHEKLGFSKAAHFKEVGFKFNQWLDVGYWQKNLGTAD